MIIAEQPRFILFSMEKTGTSSMDVALAAWFDQVRCRQRLDGTLGPLGRLRSGLARLAGRPQGADCWNADPSLKHCSPRWLHQRRVALLDGAWEDYFKACFVRHPLDRLLSVYSFHTQKLADRYPEARRAGSFRNWLEMGGTGSARKSMKRFVCDEDGRVMADFIGRYEQMDDDWRTFLQRAGLGDIPLPRVATTRTEHEDWRAVWTAELLAIFRANAAWREDAEFFGYALPVAVDTMPP